MNMPRFFWGTLFIATGVLLLLAKLDILTLEIGSLWKFWPLALIIWGVGLMTGTRAFRALGAVAAALLVALIIYSSIEGWVGESTPREMNSQNFVETEDTTVRQASFRFVSGAGSFHLNDTCVELLRADAKSNIGKYEFQSDEGESAGGTRSMSMELRSNSKVFHMGVKNEVMLRLCPRPLWDLNFQIGAASLDLDLTPYITGTVTIKAGAGDIRVKLSERADECTVHVEAGASSVAISVPKSAGCEIHTETGLSSKSFAGFEEKGDGYYQTSKYAEAAKKIHLEFKTGVSSLKVVRE